MTDYICSRCYQGYTDHPQREGREGPHPPSVCIDRLEGAERAAAASLRDIQRRLEAARAAGRIW